MTAMVRYVPQPPPRRNRVKDTARALWGVLCLLIGAIDALATALLGVRPLAGPWAQIRAVIADQWRMAYLDAREADIVDEESEVDDVDS